VGIEDGITYFTCLDFVRIVAVAERGPYTGPLGKKICLRSEFVVRSSCHLLLDEFCWKPGVELSRKLLFGSHADHPVRVGNSANCSLKLQSSLQI
jgi:hypothetical protein